MRSAPQLPWTEKLPSSSSSASSSAPRLIKRHKADTHEPDTPDLRFDTNIVENDHEEQCRARAPGQILTVGDTSKIDIAASGVLARGASLHQFAIDRHSSLSPVAFLLSEFSLNSPAMQMPESPAAISFAQPACSSRPGKQLVFYEPTSDAADYCSPSPPPSDIETPQFPSHIHTPTDVEPPQMISASPPLHLPACYSAPSSSCSSSPSSPSSSSSPSPHSRDIDTSTLHSIEPSLATRRMLNLDGLAIAMPQARRIPVLTTDSVLSLVSPPISQKIVHAEVRLAESSSLPPFFTRDDEDEDDAELLHVDLQRRFNHISNVPYTRHTIICPFGTGHNSAQQGTATNTAKPAATTWGSRAQQRKLAQIRRTAGSPCNADTTEMAATRLTRRPSILKSSPNSDFKSCIETTDSSHNRLSSSCHQISGQTSSNTFWKRLILPFSSLSAPSSPVTSPRPVDVPVQGSLSARIPFNASLSETSGTENGNDPHCVHSLRHLPLISLPFSGSRHSQSNHALDSPVLPSLRLTPKFSSGTSPNEYAEPNSQQLDSTCEFPNGRETPSFLITQGGVPRPGSSLSDSSDTSVDAWFDRSTSLSGAAPFSSLHLEDLISPGVSCPGSPISHEQYRFEHPLPIITHPAINDCMCVSADTLSRLVRGVFSSTVLHYLIVDCRFQYEYDGGHIRGAINICDHTTLKQHLLDSPLNKDTVIIFHCEFSQKRAPKLYRYLRSQDRIMNTEVYPELYYPNICLLEGGYKQFYASYPELCDPQGYVEMADIRFRELLKEGMRKLRKRPRRDREHSVGRFANCMSSPVIL